MAKTLTASLLPVLNHSVDAPPVPEAAGGRVRVVSMGCKVNQYEAQQVQEAFQKQGFALAGDDESADLCVINTCTVTGEADSKARQLIRRLGKQNPGSRTIVFGCYAARDRAALEALPGVVAVVGDNRELPDVLQRFGVMEWPGGIDRFDGHRRAFVKTQDGCALRCSYCIIPAVRGGLRSREPLEIVEEVRRLVDSGYREVVLTGIHLGHYGVELTRARSGRPKYRLAHLISDLNRIPGDWRMRLSSLDAGEVDADFLERIADCDRLCPHFHICLQSGSDDVLARMRRRYRSARFLENVAAIHDRYDRPALTTDVIVGFPGESEADFEATLEVCGQARFMKIHAFPFSARKGTPAAAFPDQIPADVKTARMERLGQLENDLAADYHRSLEGMTLSVMVEARPAVRQGHLSGTACRFARVEFSATSEAFSSSAGTRIGQLVPVRILGTHAREVVGCEVV